MSAFYVFFVILIFGLTSYFIAPHKRINNAVTHQKDFDSHGRYILHDFDINKPVSNFLSGLGGIWGIPMWAFYVNRGQGITSFGVQNKDNAILKFYTAEKAYQLTPFIGFRTFIKGIRKSMSWNHMPFFPRMSDEIDKNLKRNMHVGMNEMEIEEVESTLGIRTNILYFTIPNQNFPGLVRRTTITNIDEKLPLNIEVIDGLARVLPGGLGNNDVDMMGRTREAWMNVYNIPGDNSNGLGSTQPFYHISQGTEDTAVVQIISDGHFAISFLETAADATPAYTVSPLTAEPDASKLLRPLPMIVDPVLVFGLDTTLTKPRAFFDPKSPPLQQILAKPQVMVV